MSQKFENLLNLALETGENIRSRTDNLNVGFDVSTRSWEVIVKYHDSLSFLIDYGIKVEYLIAGYAILTVPEGYVEALSGIEEIEYVEKSKKYYFQAVLPGENSCIYPVTVGETGLTGNGVILAVIDSGIDYRRMDFRNADGSTRLIALWDQTLDPGENGQPPEGFETGVEFPRERINAALMEEEEKSFQSVPSRDVSGHGTAVAGIAAGSRVNTVSGIYQGIAPESALLVVKLGDDTESGFPKTTQIMRAVTYAVRKGIQRQSPVVINLSFGNTYGSHDGSSLLERFLDNASEIGRNVICAGAGNEADTAGHFAGNINNDQIVEIAAGEYERSLSIQLWKQYSDRFRVRLQAPDGSFFTLNESVNAKTQEFILGRTRVLVYSGEPKPYSVLQEIYFELVPTGDNNYIDSGIWQLYLDPITIVSGKFDCYLPGSEARSSRSVFLRATSEMTLTIPSTASKIVTVGAYDTVYEQYAAFSGRGIRDVGEKDGITLAQWIKPDIVAPGVNIVAPDVLGGYRTVTGTSFAAPAVSGSAALLMEWGILRGNDRYLYGEKIKAYLRRGARPLRGENMLPNERVGFGKLCIADSLPENNFSFLY